jgi:hypothetical protein
MEEIEECDSPSVAFLFYCWRHKFKQLLQAMVSYLI